MATGVLGLGSSGSTGLNQELIDNLKAAERVAFVEPIEKDIENITSDIEKFDEVNQAVLDVLDAIRPFDLFITGGANAFEQKSASTTGSSVLFDATDVASLTNGTMTVDVTQIGQKDVFQSNLKTADEVAGNVSDYSFTINGVAVTSAENDFVSLQEAIDGAKNGSTTLSASYNADTGDFTIDSVTVNVKDEKITDYKGLIKAFNAESSGFIEENYTTFSFSQDSKPTYQSDAVISASDVIDSSIIDSTDPDAEPTTINIYGTEFTITSETTYQDLVNDINSEGTLKAEITSSGRLSITSSDGVSELTPASDTRFNKLGMSNEIKITTNGLSYDDLASKINDVDGITASMSEVSAGNFRLVVKTDDVGTANALNFSGDLTRSLGLTDNFTSNTYDDTDTTPPSTTSQSLTLSVDGTKYSFDIQDMTLDDIANKINLLGDTDGSGFIDGTEVAVGITASIIGDANSGYQLVISKSDGSVDGLEITGDASKTLDLYKNHTLTAQDMKMTVDGVEFEAASNKLIVDGLTINATTTGTSTITIDNDTSYLTTQVQAFVDAYNALTTLVDENTQADSEMYNKTGLKAIVDTIKQMMFSTYGEPTLGREPKSLFEYGLGFDADLSGKITLDETAFAEALTNDLEGLKQLFIGTAARDEDKGTNDRGFGTLLKETLDGMFFSKGLVSQFETSLTDRKDTLNTDLEKAEETLNNKYDQLAAQFSAYTAIITQFETAFGGLKMMMDQSVATSN